MAYPKITVNTGKALEVISHNTYPIPSPNAVQLSGQTDGTTADKLVDSGADFSNVIVGDIIYNTTDSTVTTVSAVDSSTILSVSDNIFTTGEDYIVFQAGPHFEVRIECVDLGLLQGTHLGVSCPPRDPAMQLHGCRDVHREPGGGNG